MPSENEDKRDELIPRGKAHCNRRRCRFLLLFECTDDGINRLIKQAGGFYTGVYNIRRPDMMA